jgi:two-component system, LytTR family, response regulator LytT
MKILIVEDDILIAEHLKTILVKEGYNQIFLAHNYKAAFTQLENQKIHLLFLDINLNEEKTGINLAHLINEKYKIPYVFITAQSDPESITEIIKANPDGYINKPFKAIDVITQVKIIEKKKINIIKIKEGKHEHTFNTDDILYIQSVDNYIEIHFKTNKQTIRYKLSEIENILPKSKFIRIYRSYIVNKNAISSYNSKEVIINSSTIPLSRDFNIELFKE